MKNFIIRLGFFLAAILFMAPSVNAQIVGGAGFIKTKSNPNTISSLTTIDQRVTGSFALDTVSQILYRYDRTAASGARWVVMPTTANPIVSVVGGGDITVTNVGSVYTVSYTNTNNPLVYTIADNPVHAASLGVLINQTFLASNSNTMGVPSGTYVQRMF